MTPSDKFYLKEQSMHLEMDSFEDKGTESHSQEAREFYVLAAKMEELHRAKEELKQAKDEAMQSWLDSKPLIDELERLQANLASAKGTSEDRVVSELESELMAINMSIRAKKEDELRLRTSINEMTRASECTRKEMEQVKLETSGERRARSNLKQVIKLRRQSLRTLKLTLRATRLESEAYSASAAAALHQNSLAKMDNSTKVELTQEDYFALMRRAKEETSLADWRVAVAIEQRLVAEETRDLALKRLMEPSLNGGSMNMKMEGELYDENKIMEEEVPRIRVNAQTPFPKARAKLMAEGGALSDRKQTQVNKKRLPIFVEVKAFLAQKIRFLFG